MKIKLGKKLFAILLMLIMAAGSGYSAEFVKLDKKVIDAPVKAAFLEKEPLIDGVLDKGLEKLTAESFNYFIQFTPGKTDAKLKYRMAYGTGFLYLFITLETDEFIVRDRGYQNGDGFVFYVNGKPGKGEKEEKIMLSFAPEGETLKKLSFKWFDNGKWMFSPLSKRTRFEVKKEGNRIGYELLLSWQDIYPLHPWMSDSIDFNINFSKASGETGLTIYSCKAVEGSPEPDMKDHLPMSFLSPVIKNGPQYCLVLKKNHLEPGEKPKIKSVVVSSCKGREEVEIEIKSEEKKSIFSETINLETGKEVLSSITPLDVSLKDAGEYILSWKSEKGDSPGSIRFTILPDFDIQDLKKRVGSLRGKPEYGTVTTMKFYLEDIFKQKENLRVSDDCPGTLKKMKSFLETLETAEQGKDPVMLKRGYVRRAFLSQVDKTLRPYTVKVPDNFDSSKKYPAIVFLHGSDTDDTIVKRHFYLERGDIFIIAPHGRNLRSAYTIDNAQEDIAEAVEDALKNYPIDKKRLVLAGFSMGGYGAYRTFHETPERYKGVAVFSGHPSLAEEYFPGKGHPDFLQEEYLKNFKGANFIIFHGRKDRNTEFEITDGFVKKLKRAGAKVKYFVDENAGHRPPKDKKIWMEYYRWLAEALK